MRIGELAKRCGCPVETVRYYEREGLLQIARRSGANYREYGAEHVERLQFILRCRSLDMSLPEIRALLAALDRPGADCAPIDALLDEHIGHIAGRIAELQNLKDELDAIRAHCAGEQPARDCGIVASLRAGTAARRVERSHVPSSHRARRAR